MASPAIMDGVPRRLTRQGPIRFRRRADIVPSGLLCSPKCQGRRLVVSDFVLSVFMDTLCGQLGAAREGALAHGIVAFLFNVSVLALVLNIAANVG
jgi:hypothetical protein